MHKRIFSDRDSLFYWLYALGKVGAGTSLVFITPRSPVQARPPLPSFPSFSISYNRLWLETYGWRVGRIADPFGNHWEIGKPISEAQWVSEQNLAA